MKDDYYLDPRVAESYDGENPGLPGDVEFYRRLALEGAATGLPVLELGCGTGRVSIPIAKAGVRVVGLDHSAAMLEVARRKSEGLENVRWVEGDMAEFECDERFGLIFIPARSFLLLLSVAEQKGCLAAVRGHLALGGRLALNFFNPDLAMMATWLGSLKNRSELLSRPGSYGPRRREWATRRYLTADQQLDEDRVTEELSDAGAVISRVYRNLRLRYVFRFEMEHLLALSGFEVEALYGGFRGEAFTDGSSEMVWVAHRA